MPKHFQSLRKPARTVALVLLLSCPVLCYGGYCSATAEDAWYLAKPSTAPPAHANWLAAKFVARVADTMQADAQQKLDRVAFLPISASDAEAFLGKGVSPPSNRYFLLRALEYPRRPGDFLVRELDGIVTVTFATLGDTPPRAERAAIIALLEREPVAVFVDCSSAI